MRRYARHFASPSFAPELAAAVEAGSGIDPVLPGALSTDAALHELVPRLVDVAELDLASQDVLVEVIRALEKQLWMLSLSLPAD